MRPFQFALVLCPALASAAPETFPEANGLVRTLVAREPLLKNPVSVAADVDGAIYVTETTRRKVADLDIREFTQWIPNDLSHTTVEDKLAFFRKAITSESVVNHPSLKDHNKDGRIDSKDLTVHSERIIRLTDSDGDGVMDGSQVFADGFNTEVTGIAAGVFAWRGDVYATIAPDVWKLRDTTGNGIADQRESIAHGFGVHIAYAGHDMHGLIRGPDGRIYWSIGDKGSNVLSKEGKRWEAPHEGAVLRCFPDGSGFEIFARGLRNPQEIAFDQYGNLFSVDNDADFKGERERFVYITEGSDSGWRCHYQYRGSAYNPWLAEQIWQPSGSDQPAYITPPISNYSDGPAGFAFNPGTALNPRYRDSFFVTEFPIGHLRAFKVKPAGASFEMVDDHLVLAGPKAIGCSFGPAGELFLADWSGGYPLNEQGAVWKIDDPAETSSETRVEVAELLKAGPGDALTGDLIRQLVHPDQRVRLDAQWELAKRGAVDEFKVVALSASSPQLAVIHALWGLQQAESYDFAVFEKIAASANDELRAQAAKYAGESASAAVPALIPLLADRSDRVRFHAAVAVGKLRMTEALDAALEMLAENANRDPFLRHAGVLALAAMEDGLVAEKTLKHASPAVRLAAAVTFRRTASPQAARLLSDVDGAVVAEAARAIYDAAGIPAAMPDLAKLIETNPSATGPALRRSIAANRRVADAAAAERLVAFAADEAVSVPLRIAALEALGTWVSGVDLDLVDGRWNPVPSADAAIAVVAFGKFSDRLQQSQDRSLREQAAAVATALGLSSSPADLAKVAAEPSADAERRARAVESLHAADAGLGESTALPLLADPEPRVRISAARVLASSHPEAVLAYAARAISGSPNLTERQQAVAVLPEISSPAAARLLVKLLADESEEQANPNIWVELAEAAGLMKNADPEVASAAAAWREKQQDEGGLVPHLHALEGGDAELGRRVFNEHLAAQCVACHRIGDEGSNVGPPLTEIGRKDRTELLESLVLPQARIASGFGMMSVTLNDGTALAGLLVEETDGQLKLRLPDGSESSIPLTEISSRNGPVSTMPPMGEILSSRELRDLVEFLSTLK